MVTRILSNLFDSFLLLIKVAEYKTVQSLAKKSDHFVFMDVFYFMWIQVLY